MTKILFICHGNICRSPMAEYVMKDLVERHRLSDAFEIASAATSTEEIGNDVHRGTRQILATHHIPCGHRQAVRVTAADYDYYDFLILMDQHNYRNLKRIIPDDPAHKVHFLLDFAEVHGDIADPWYTGDFELTYQDVLRGCMGLLGVLGEGK